MDLSAGDWIAFTSAAISVAAGFIAMKANKVAKEANRLAEEANWLSLHDDRKELLDAYQALFKYVKGNPANDEKGCIERFESLLETARACVTDELAQDLRESLHACKAIVRLEERKNNRIDTEKFQKTQIMTKGFEHEDTDYEDLVNQQSENHQTLGDLHKGIKKAFIDQIKSSR